jgi:hypothetical protein
MFATPARRANLTKGRPRMAVITPLHPICELADRSNGGIEVTLLWNRRTDELTVCVADAHAGVSFALQARKDNALDVFHHPYAYAAGAAAAGPEQPLPRAA